MPKAATPCFTPRIPSASLSTIRICTQTVGLRASDLDTIMHGVAEAVAQYAPPVATQRQCRIHDHPLSGPGCLVEPKQTHSKRLFVATLEGQSAWVRNRIHEKTAEEVSNPLLVYIDLLALLYIFYTRRLCVLW